MIEPYEGARAGRNRWRAGAVTAAAVLAAYLPSSPASAGSPGATERVSVATSGAQGTGGSVSSPSVSDNGFIVAFHSRAERLVPNDTNNREDVFVKDRTTGSLARVSVSSAGEQAEGPSLSPKVSGNGRFVLFGSGAPNLVPGDTNADPPAPTASAEAIGRDLFLHDLLTGQTTRESVTDSEEEGRCFEPTDPSQFRFCAGGVALAEADITPDGRFIAFASNAENMIGRGNDTNGQTDVFVRDRLAGTTTRVSVRDGGTQATGGASVEPSISADGRFVAFASNATNLVPNDTNGQRDVFVHDRQTTTTTRVSVLTGGGQGCVGSGSPVACPAASGAGASSLPTISDNGNLVSFASAATFLVPGDTNGDSDIFVHDRTTTTTTRVSVATGGTQANDGSFFPSMTSDGRFVSFDSIASNLVPGDTNALSDAFVHDRQTGTTSRASLTRSLGQANGASYFPALTPNGRYVVFASDASNLVPGDNNVNPDVFIHDRTLPRPNSTGYRLVASDGGVFAFGDAPFRGSTGALRLVSPVVGTAALPDGSGYWMAAADGGVFAFGRAGFYGSAAGRTLAKPIVAMAATPTGAGYWLVGGDGAVLAFGDARNFGSTAALRLAQPIVGIAPSFTGSGYFLVAADGGVFAFGDAVFRGSTGAIRLAQPIVGMAATPSGLGYHLVASDGGVFAFGDAVFRGSMGATRINQPVVGITANPSGGGYWLVARDGGIFAFGDAGFYGSTGAIRLNQPIVAVAAAG